MFNEEEKNRFWGLQSYTIYVEGHPIVVVGNREDVEWFFEFMDDISDGAPMEIVSDCPEDGAFMMQYKLSFGKAEDDWKIGDSGSITGTQQGCVDGPSAPTEHVGHTFTVLNKSKYGGDVTYHLGVKCSCGKHHWISEQFALRKE